MVVDLKRTISWRVAIKACSEPVLSSLLFIVVNRKLVLDNARLVLH